MQISFDRGRKEEQLRQR
ncbi:unnamed protein product [Victoria cruziana]